MKYVVQQRNVVTQSFGSAEIAYSVNIKMFIYVGKHYDVLIEASILFQRSLQNLSCLEKIATL